MFYVLHGDDEYRLRQWLDAMKGKLGDSTTADLNTTVLDGRSLALDELRMTCDTLPFLAEQRVVVVEGLLARYEPRSGAAESGKQRTDPIESGLRAYLPSMPETANLVFLEQGALSDKNPLLKTLKDLGGKIHEFTPPGGADLTAWISEHVRVRGGTISPRAAETMGAYVGGNLRQLAQEIDKLIAYARGRQIQEGDIHLLVADAREMKVWALTDALAAHNRHLAASSLRRMLDEGDQPLMLLAMIARQFRTLVQVKDLADARFSSEEIARQLHINPYGARRAVDSARGFSFEQLDAIYGRLLDTDLAVKTGRLEPALALDLLVMDLTETAAHRR